MHLSIDSIQPIIDWLQENPEWGLLFTFIISFTESLAIIGSIIPGSLTMTAIGILAGSGVIRLDLTLISATLGAIVGDGASYLLGQIFSDRLIQIWPFSRYPTLLQRGKQFFLKHGGKSVLIGRFVGPLRSIIPVIAGMMKMPRLHFFFANAISAVGWAILYVIPGYLIGTASTQLSTESARRLFGFVIALLLGVWLASQGTRWLAKWINRWYDAHLNSLGIWSKNHPRIKYLFNALATGEEKNNSTTIALTIAWLACILFFLVLLGLVYSGPWLAAFNKPLSIFFQNSRTPLFDAIFIILSFITSSLTLFSLCFCIGLAIIYAKDWRLLKYWISLAISTFLLPWLIATCITVPNPTNFFNPKTIATFPIINLAWATGLYSFLIYYLVEYYRNELTYMLRALIIIILILVGFSSVYLGDNWMSSVLGSYFIGLAIGLTHWILYRRKPAISYALGKLIALTGAVLVLSIAFEYTQHFRQVIRHHTIKPQQFMLSEEDWWHQSKPMLPIYTTNRLGKPIGIFNIQYAGSLDLLEEKLADFGWKKQENSFLYSLLIRVGGQYSVEALPFLSQLYLNKKPALMMTYNTLKDDNLYVLRLWRSNYHIRSYEEPIWLGSVIMIHKKGQSKSISNRHHLLFTPIYPALKDFDVTNVPIKDEPAPYCSEVLLIKE